MTIVGTEPLLFPGEIIGALSLINQWILIIQLDTTSGYLLSSFSLSMGNIFMAFGIIKFIIW
jgi:hypothetical protein